MGSGPALLTGEAARVATLTQRQICVLRLSLCGLVTKEIARQLGQSQHTINKDAEAASAKLGVKGRLPCARIVMRHFYGPYERFVYEAQPLAATTVPGAKIAASDAESTVELDGVAEVRVPYVPPPMTLPVADRITRQVTPDHLGPRLRLWILVPVTALILLSIAFTLLSASHEASNWVRRAFPNYPSNR